MIMVMVMVMVMIMVIIMVMTMIKVMAMIMIMIMITIMITITIMIMIMIITQARSHVGWISHQWMVMAALAGMYVWAIYVLYMYKLLDGSGKAAIGVVEAFPRSLEVGGANEVNVATAIAKDVDPSDSVAFGGLQRGHTAHFCASTEEHVVTSSTAQ